MPSGDYFILMGVGGLFLILGIVAYLWGKHEERNYFDAIATRTNDLREFVDHWPPRPQPGASKIGGWIAIAIGLLLLVVGLIFWLLA